MSFRRSYMIQSIQDVLHSFAVWLVGLVGLGEACANYVYVLFISMVPIIELRGAMPAASILGLPFLPSLVVAIIGNLIPVPFILFFIKILYAKCFAKITIHQTLKTAVSTCHKRYSPIWLTQ